MTQPLPLKEGDRVKYRRGGNDAWSTHEWHVSLKTPGDRVLIVCGNMEQWVKRHELRKLPDKKEVA